MRAGLVAHAADYRCSSTPTHCGNAADGILSRQFSPTGVVNDWAEWLRTEDEENLALIRTTARTRRPCGGRQFLVQLESLLGWVLHPKKRGRKAKAIAGDDALEEKSTREPNS